jgi:hypothetical protein
MAFRENDLSTTPSGACFDRNDVVNLRTVDLSTAFRLTTNMKPALEQWKPIQFQKIIQISKTITETNNENFLYMAEKKGSGGSGTDGASWTPYVLG